MGNLSRFHIHPEYFDTILSVVLISLSFVILLYAHSLPFKLFNVIRRVILIIRVGDIYFLQLRIKNQLTFSRLIQF